MNLKHYYHVYAVGDWERIVNEHIDSLKESGLLDNIDAVRLGVVGSDEASGQLYNLFDKREVPAFLVATSNSGWEQVTLKVLHDELEDDTGILYAHTKGVANPSVLNDAWRQSMTRQLIGNWEVCKRLIETRECEAVGCHWLTPQRYPGIVMVPYFGGNFWWAKSGLLRRCPEPSLESRYEAEAWLGRGEPTLVADRAPGWPGFENFR